MADGWCLVCEDEGEDPRHSYSTKLCNKHYKRALRETPEGRAKYERAKQRYIERRRQRAAAQELRKGWCPDCQAEGEDPEHTRSTVRCSKHHTRMVVARRRTEGTLPPAQVVHKAGWCRDCEAEGEDPWHAGRTSLCRRHANLRWRTENPEKYEEVKRVERERRRVARERQKSPNRIERHCPQCELEGLDPKHYGDRLLCDLHSQRHKRHVKKMREQGTQPRRRRRTGRPASTSILARALDETKEKEVE